MFRRPHRQHQAHSRQPAQVGDRLVQHPFNRPLRPLSLALILAFAGSALALPSDPAVIAGQATVSRAGPANLVINQSSGKAAIDWRTFSVAANETVRFNQPSASALTVNRVTANDPSHILGQISAPGSVFLINPAGVYFGQSAVVHVGNLIASTLTANPVDLLNGRLSFSSAPGGSAAVRNDGRLETPIGGSVSLLGTQVINAGAISTPGGTTGLIAGDRIVVDFHGDGLVRYQVDAAAARALVDNQGRIEADGGRVALQASARDALVDTVLNVEGIVRARGASLRNGEIYLDGGSSGVVSVSGRLDAASPDAGASGGQIRVLGDKVGLFGHAQLDASGDAGGGSILIGGDYQGKGEERNAQQTYVGKDVTIAADALSTGDGGRIIVWADDWTRYSGSISAKGGDRQGDGGFVEVSGKQNLGFDGQVDSSAARGRAGVLLLDPNDLYVGVNPGEALAAIEQPDRVFGTPTNGAQREYFVALGSFNTISADYQFRADRDIFINADLSFTSSVGQTIQFVASRNILASLSTPSGPRFSITTAGGNLSLTAGTSTSTGSITLGAITLGGVGNRGNLTIESNGPDTMAGAIAAGAVRKLGSGEMTVSQAVNSSTLSVEGGSLLTGASSLLNGSVTVGPGASLSLNGSSQSIGGLGGSGTISLGGGQLAVTVPPASVNTFSGQISSAGTLTKAGGGRLVLSGANSILATTNVNAGTLQISGDGTLGASSVVTLANGVNAALDISGASQDQVIAGLAGGAAGAPGTAGTVALGNRTLTVRVPEGSAHTFAGTISGANGSLTKDGAGKLTLGNANIYEGTTTISGGILAVTRPDSLHVNSALVIEGGTLELAGSLSLNTLADGFSMRGAGDQGLGALRFVTPGSGGFYSGDITLKGPATIGVDPSVTVRLGGAITQDAYVSAYALTKQGAGTLELAGSRKDYRGGTEIQGGTVTMINDEVLPANRRVNLAGAAAVLDINGTTQHIGNLAGVAGGQISLGASGALHVTQADDGSFDGTISGGTFSNLTKLGSGKLTLSQANTYTGTTTVEKGVLAITRVDTLHAQSKLVVKGGSAGAGNDGGSLEIAESVVLNTLNSGAADGFKLGGVGQGGLGALKIAAGKGGGYAGEIVLTGPTSVGGDAVAPQTGGTLTLSGRILEEAAGASLTKVGSSTLVLDTTATDYTGGTYIKGGLVSLARPDALGAGTVEVSAGGTLRLENASLLSSRHPQVQIAGRGASVLGVEQGALSGTGLNASYDGKLLLAGNAGVGAPEAGDKLTLSGEIEQVSGVSSLSKLGAGTVVLGGIRKTYTGGTNIEAGRLETAAPDVLPATGVVTLENAVGAVLALTDQAQSIGGLKGGAAANAQDGGIGKVLLGSATLTVTAQTDATFLGQIEGIGGLTKEGDARFTLGHANTYEGTTKVSRGVLSVAQENALAAGSRLEVDGGTLEIAGSFTLNTLSRGFSLAGAGHENNGALTVGAVQSGDAYAAAYDGVVTLRGDVNVGGGGTAGTAGTLTLRGNIVEDSDGAQYKPQYKLTKVGQATLVLNGVAKQYAGGTDVNQGIVRVEQAQALGSGSVDVKADASLQLADGVTLLLSNPASTLTLAGSGVNDDGALRGTGTAGYDGSLVLGAGAHIGVDGPDGRLTLNGRIPATAFGFSKVGGGTLVLGGLAKDHGGPTVIRAGTVSVADSRSLGLGSTVEVQDGAVLRLDNVVLSASRNPELQIAGQGLSSASPPDGALIGSGTASFDGRVVLATANAGVGVAEGHRLTLSGAIDQLAGDDRALTKRGDGTLSLTGSRKNYRGGTFIAGGTVETGTANVLPAARPVTLSAADALLNLNGYGQLIGTLDGAQPAARIWLNGATLTVEQGAAGTFAGQIAENSQVSPVSLGRLVKTGPAQLNLPGSNSYAGGTSVEAGVLSVSDSHALGTGSVVVAGGTLAIDHVPLALAPAAELRISGAGAGGGPVGAGALTGRGANAGYDGPVYLAADARVNVPEPADTLTLKGGIAGAPGAAMRKVGDGKLVLEGAGSYTGKTIVDQGMLTARVNDGVLGTGPVEVNASSTLYIEGVLLGNDVSLLGGSLDVSGAAIIGGGLNLAQTTTLSVPTGASLEIRRALVGGGDDKSLTIDGGGTLKLFGGAHGLGSVTQAALSMLDLGSAQTVSTMGGQTYLGIVKADSATLESSSGTGPMTVDNAANQLSGSFTVTGGITHLTTTSPDLSVHLQSGETHVRASNGNLTLAGTAASLDARSAGSLTSAVTTFGDSELTAAVAASNSGRVDGDLTIAAGRIVSTGNVGGSAMLTSPGGGAISHAADVGGRLMTSTTGNTTLSGSFGELLVERTAQLSFAETHVAGGATIDAATGAISQSGGLSVDGLLTIRAPGLEVELGRQDNDFASLDITAGTTHIADKNTLTAKLQTGATTLEVLAGQLTLAGSAASIVATTSAGPISQSAALTVTGALTIGAGNQSVELNLPENDFASLDITAGTTLVTDRNGFTTTLRTGGTTLRALAGSLTAEGTASSLEARTDGAAGDVTSRVATTGNSTLSAGGAIVHSADVGARLTTRTSGQTTIAGNVDALAVVQSGGLSFGLTTVNKEAAISVGGPLTQTAALQVNQRTTIDAGAHSVTLDRADNRFAGGLRLTAGDSEVRTGSALDVVLDTGSTRLDAGALHVAGSMRLSPSVRSHLVSATTVELGQLSIAGSGVVDVVANQAEMPKVAVPRVSVQDAAGVPARVEVYGSSIYQAAEALLQTAPEVNLNLVARRASIDLTAGAAAASVGEGQLRKTGPGGLIEVYSAPLERQALLHPNGLTNRLQGPVSAITEVDANQAGNGKTVVAIASDTISIAATPLPAIDADTVLLLGRTMHGGGGKIQTHVGATLLRDGRNIATDPERRDDNAFSILPSIFVIADVNAAPPVGSPSSLQFGDLGSPISLSFGAVSAVANNSWLQTIAVEPFRQDLAGGDVPVYFGTTAAGGVDPGGVVARRLVYPSSLARTAVRPVIVDGRKIEDSSAYDAVQSSVAEVLNQVRKEQLESGFSNENVAAQLRKGVITETRVGQAAVNRFQGVTGVRGCVGLTIDDQIVCAPAAGSSKP